MNDEPSAPSGRDLGQALLEAKLSAPELRAGSISRARLIERARSSKCRVIGVTAPAGFGKSTFLAEWASVDERPVAWVSLDRLDNDPSSLLAILASAYMRIDPHRHDLLAELGRLGDIGLSVLVRAAPRLAAAFRSSPVPFVLILDDLHELSAPACHDVLALVMTKLPQGSQVVTASRSEQPHLARLRASGDGMEFTAADLALDESAVRQIFSVEHVSVSAEVAAAVMERTEGWPVGIYLAAVIARENNGNVAMITGDDRYVADYLYHESFAGQPEDTQQFLFRTAVLDQLCGPLCDAVLGSSGSTGQLRRLEASSTFVVALDRRRQWYRYHALFREFLLGELERSEPGLVEKLHFRAADWYEANGSPSLALEHLLQTSDQDRALQLLAKLEVPTFQAGRLTTTKRWRSALGEEAIKSYPPLAIRAAWGAVLTGDTKEAEKWSAFLDTASFDSPMLDGSASFTSSRARLRAGMCADGPEAMMADAAFALSQEPEHGYGRPNALIMLGEAHLVAGRLAEAQAVLAEASKVAQAEAGAGRVSTVIIMAEADLALLAMDRGSWQEADDHLKKAQSEIDDRGMQDYVLSLLTYAAAARLALHRGDHNHMRDQLARAMRGRPMATYVLPTDAVRLRLQLAKIYLALGDTTTARHLLREIDDILTRRPALGALADQVEEFGRVLASAPAGAASASPLTPAELRLLPYLQTHLTLGAIAERLFVSRNTVSSEVTSIYRKLGVSSRLEAVDRATRLGLLGG